MFRRRPVWAGLAIVGQLLLAFGSDAAHRLVAHRWTFDQGCACSHSPDHGHSHARTVDEAGVCESEASGAWQVDLASSVGDDGVAEPSADAVNEMAFASFHDQDTCGLCRFFARSVAVPISVATVASAESSRESAVLEMGRIASHRSLGHDGRGPPFAAVRTTSFATRPWPESAFDGEA